jgi:hypothetical protein
MNNWFVDPVSLKIHCTCGWITDKQGSEAREEYLEHIEPLISRHVTAAVGAAMAQLAAEIGQTLYFKEIDVLAMGHNDVREQISAHVLWRALQPEVVNALADYVEQQIRKAIDRPDHQEAVLKRLNAISGDALADALRKARVEGKIEQHEKDCGLCQIYMKYEKNKAGRLTDCYPRRDLEVERISALEREARTKP